MTKVKICGITRAVDAHKAVELGAWALGFIFYKKSPRCVTPTDARKIIEALPPFVTPVGLFVNEKEEDVSRIANFCGIRTLQFHGGESPAYCRRFRYSRYKVIKAFAVNEQTDFLKIRRYEPDAYLFDTYHEKLHGGTGKVFDWQILQKNKMSKPVILAGGLGPQNIKKAIKAVRPYGVDVSSGVETSPGVKNEALLVQLFKQIRGQ
jgi:phosphoribosylanthranilate isomerase